jgi:translation initiation factor IF-3
LYQLPKNKWGKNYFYMNNKFKEKSEKINHQITAQSVRLVFTDGTQPFIATIREAIQLAKENGVDLVEISPNANPPVCKIIDYSKFLYEKKKNDKKNDKNNKKSKLKEIRMTYNTGDHDFDFKLNHAIEFLKDGDKVKVFIFFSGREINFRDVGELLLLKFIDQLKEFGKIDNMPKLDGKRLWVIVQPKK